MLTTMCQFLDEVFVVETVLTAGSIGPPPSSDLVLTNSPNIRTAVHIAQCIIKWKLVVVLRIFTRNGLLLTGYQRPRSDTSLGPDANRWAQYYWMAIFFCCKTFQNRSTIIPQKLEKPNSTAVRYRDGANYMIIVHSRITE